MSNIIRFNDMPTTTSSSGNDYMLIAPGGLARRIKKSDLLSGITAVDNVARTAATNAQTTADSALEAANDAQDTADAAVQSAAGAQDAADTALGLVAIKIDNLADYLDVVYVDKNATALSGQGVPAYATLQAAYDAISGTSIEKVIKVGTGLSSDFGGLTLTSSYNSKVIIVGNGIDASKLGAIAKSTADGTITLITKDCSFAGVTGASTDFTLSGGAYFGNLNASTSTSNAQGGAISLIGSSAGTVTSN